MLMDVYPGIPTTVFARILSRKTCRLWTSPTAFCAIQHHLGDAGSAQEGIYRGLVFSLRSHQEVLLHVRLQLWRTPSSIASPIRVPLRRQRLMLTLRYLQERLGQLHSWRSHLQRRRPLRYQLLAIAYLGSTAHRFVPRGICMTPS